MKKELPFLIVFFTILITMIFLAPYISIPVYADGAFIDNDYSYSITIKRSTGIISIIQSTMPIFLDGFNVRCNGSVQKYSLNTGYVYDSFAIYTTYSYVDTFSELLDSSTDLYDLTTKQVVFQSEQTDNVVISEQTIKTFYYMFGVLFGGIMSVTFSTSFKMGV